ncbi:hypothetical protein FPV67DRAFT_1013295 [Lyophyllum atratum]|nr:hypothetical protein FPV67DRAFT_1013295 [Lyophyllum atratum]
MMNRGVASFKFKLTEAPLQPMASRRQVLGPRSSLLSHVFPPFYACYLLKSIQTPRSKATYIGSTPSPPRRIRQHNGELKQGAWKTRLRRPWVMQMIVHGFPSRLAALQFEWAWQHPEKSRHLRDASGEALFTARMPKHVKTNVQIVRTMIANHPYHKWPLHVKLFTEDAVTAWNEATKDITQTPMPPGFTYSIELEGVDGKSGKVGSGRCVPISVKDEQFTSSYLAKNTALLVSNCDLKCAICDGLLTDYTTDALSTALCPAPTCTAVTHILCLSRQFLEADPSERGLIPRGGKCTCCNTYTLWGDFVRGSYRRMVGGVAIEEEDTLETDQGELYNSDGEQLAIVASSRSTTKKPAKRKAKSPAAQARKTRQKKTSRMGAAESSSGGELFDFDVDSTDGASGTPRRRGRAVNASSLTIKWKTATSPAKKGRPEQEKTPQASSSSEEYLFEPSVNPIHKPSVSPRKLGRPQQASSAVSAATTRNVISSSPPTDKSIRKKPLRSRRSTSTEGELFDSDASMANHTPRKRGRPRKAPSLVSLPASPSPRTTTTVHELPVIPRKRGRPPKGSPAPIAGPSIFPHSRATVKSAPGKIKGWEEAVFDYCRLSRGV